MALKWWRPTGYQTHSLPLTVLTVKSEDYTIASQNFQVKFLHISGQFSDNQSSMTYMTLSYEYLVHALTSFGVHTQQNEGHSFALHLKMSQVRTFDPNFFLDN